MKLDDAPNYGNTGATIGHELTHAFDDEGRQFDSQGQSPRLVDRRPTPKALKTASTASVTSTRSYIIVDDIHINSKLTSGEDVADLGGTLLAYIAWQKQDRRPSTLKDRSTASPPTSASSSAWPSGPAKTIRPETLSASSAVTDPHSPGFARINGVVSNMPEFQKAFGCKAGQPMVHTPTCKVW